MEDDIFDLISRLIKTLQDVAIDERHTPHLYARFLSGLLMKHRKGGSSIAGRLQPHPPASELALPSQQSYLASRDPSGPSHTGTHTQHATEPRHDGNPMQLTLTQMPNVVETPQLGSTMAPQSDMASYIHAILNDDSVLDTSLDGIDVSMADVMGETGTLAAMHALNEVWWGNMMMPGCVFFPAVLSSASLVM